MLCDAVADAECEVVWLREDVTDDESAAALTERTFVGVLVRLCDSAFEVVGLRVDVRELERVELRVAPWLGVGSDDAVPDVEADAD